jgi:hypothetical protein
MNSLRFSGVVFCETCSAETTGALDDEDVQARVERELVVAATRWGVSEAAATTPGSSLISSIRRRISSGLTGSW